jgi:hypothetical protein
MTLETGEENVTGGNLFNFFVNPMNIGILKDVSVFLWL